MGGRVLSSFDKNAMPELPEHWDYLVLTASNDQQARAYEAQLGFRRQTGQLARVRETLVVTDLEGRRIGSGGSTIQCLALVVNRERRKPGTEGSAAEEILRRLRILMVHAGGDSRRLPAYAPGGKIFMPLPGESRSALGLTLFDRLVPPLLDLAGGAPGEGQVVVAAGDALVRFDAPAVRLSDRGMIALGSHASPEEACGHGVFCVDDGGSIRLYLQKPSLAEQAAYGAITRLGRTVLDIGVMSLDAAAAATLLGAFGVRANRAGGDLEWREPMRSLILSHGLDLYREICCAMGTEATLEHYVRTARASGSKWNDELFREVFPTLREIPFRIRVVPQCSFLHFGSSGQLVTSGLALAVQDEGAPPAVTTLSLNNQAEAGGTIAGADSWVEGCRLSAPLTLGGRNVVTGVDVGEPLWLPRGACLDVVPGRTRAGERTWFARCYGVEDSFKDATARGATFCGQPLADWLGQAGARAEDVWVPAQPPEERSLWNARIFPAESSRTGYRRWLWMFEPGRATAEEKRAFLAADRYSAAEIACLADHEAFQLRRAAIRAEEVRRTLNRLYRRDSDFSAEDLAFTLGHSEDRAAVVRDALALAQEYAPGRPGGRGLESFTFCRIVHSLGAAIENLAGEAGLPLETVVPGMRAALPERAAAWLSAADLWIAQGEAAGEWAGRLRAVAFRHLNATILGSGLRAGERPRSALRPDETIWGRGPARIELGGGWTDTPPYTLEFGGDVANTAVNLNGQPPIHCYCRIVEEPVIRLSSIDGGAHLEIRELDELRDYRRPEDRFALAKAALAISGFAPEAADWPAGISLGRVLEAFGGGIELTTLVGIPKGSGLGTSSILGAVIMAVIGRMMGRCPSQRELFHDVLRLEQALTTGGGWQDQIGGGVGGAKITSTRPGLIPDPRIHYLPSDILDPKTNGGSTLLYYTGLTRLAKDILQEIVGKYFNRHRATMATLQEEHVVAQCVAGALSRKDAAALGRYVDAAWQLQKRLCGFVTNEAIETLLGRVRPYVHGMRISGAGSGGFLFMIAKSPADAARIREMLEGEPLNERSRFFDFEVNHAGIEVTTC